MSAKQYRYRPKGNRTPVTHPVFGHLSWDGIYSNPECADNPDFEEIKGDESDSSQDKPDADKAKPGAKDNPIVVALDNASGESPAKAGKSGRR